MRFNNYQKFIHTEQDGGHLVFYLKDKDSQHQLFRKKAYAGLIQEFRNDISVPQLLRRHKWGEDKMADHVMELLPRYISYIEKYVA